MSQVREVVTADVIDLKKTLEDSSVAYYEFGSNISIDGFLAQDYFQNFLDGELGMQPTLIRNRSGEVDYVVIYCDGVDSEDTYFKISHLRAKRKADLIELAHELDYNHLDEDYLKREIIEDLMQITYDDYYKAHYAMTDWRELDYDLSIRGYSQGDIARCKILGKQPIEDMDTYLTQLFYEAPISGSIEIMRNGEVIREIYIDEVVDDVYGTWEQDEVIKKLATLCADEEYSHLITEKGEEFIPHQLKYGY